MKSHTVPSEGQWMTQSMAQPSKITPSDLSDTWEQTSTYSFFFIVN